MKSIKIEKRDFIPNNSIKRTLSLGISSCITQLTVLALFIFMNNIMTKFGGSSKFGSDIPLSVYGVASKINSLFISSVLGIAIGSQPIIGFNYGAGYYDRVKMTMRKVLTINFIIGIIFNLAFVIFPKQLIGIFISPTDPSYDLFIEFAVLLFRTFLVVSAINALEMSTSTMLQSLGNVVSATAVSFIRQIILFIPIALILCIGFNKGIYGALYAGPIADTICFIICIFVFRHEYVSVGKNKHTTEETHEYKNDNYNGKKIIITISREYGSGGRYVGELLARKLGINFYDKEIITLASKESGLSESYVEETDEKKNKQLYANNNDDRIFIAEKKVIEDLASKESFVIVGRCADYILKDNKDTFKVFIYSDDENKVNRAVKYYGLNKNNALKEINKINKDRSKHYKYYTNREWYDFNNYDISINSDSLGIESTVDLISNIINSKLSD
jgi:cytidylate kinase